MENNEGKKNNNVLKFFETLILITLIGIVIMIVLENFFNQINGEDDYYYEEDYYYDDYEEDYYSEDYSSYYDDYNYYNEYDYENNINENTNTVSNFVSEDNTNTVSNFASIEDFMNSESGKNFLREPDRNQVATDKTVVENVVEDSEDTLDADSEDIYNYYDNQAKMKEKFEEQKKKIEVKEVGKSINNEIIISIENKNNDFVYDLTLNTVFYKSNEIVHIDVQEINVITANNKKYLKISNIPEQYDDYEFVVSKRYYMEYYNELLNDDVSFSSYKNDGAIEIQIHNNSSQKINRAHFTILYYDSQGNLLDFDTAQEYSIRAKKTGETIVYGIWDDEKNKYLEFSDYEIILDYAENYGY